MAVTIKPENPPAFPLSNSKAYGNSQGMTLRDYFAAKAMQGMVNSDNYANNSYNDIANYSYTMADAMLKARSK